MDIQDQMENSFLLNYGFVTDKGHPIFNNHI